MKRPRDDDDLDRRNPAICKLLADVRTTFDKENFDEFRKLMQGFIDRKINIPSLLMRLREFLKDHPDLIAKFNQTQPEQCRINLEGKENMGKALKLIQEIKIRLKGEGLHDEFIRILSRMDGKSSVHVYQEVSQLFSNHEDLLEKFSHFIPSDSAIRIRHHPLHEGSVMHRDVGPSEMPVMKHGDKVDDIPSKDPATSGRFNRFLTQNENTDELLKMEADTVEKQKKGDCVREKDGKGERLKRGAPFIPKDKAKKKCSLLKNKEKHIESELVSELDISNRQQCTVSYSYDPQPPASNRTKLSESVLNHVWVSHGSHSGNFEIPHRGQYKSLFAVEDDRFEQDMLLEKLNATIKQIDKFLEIMPKVEQNQIRLEDHFDSSSLNCIEHLYDKHGERMIENLRRYPCTMFALILTRLKEQKKECSKFLSNANPVWAQVFKNFKSLITASI